MLPESCLSPKQRCINKTEAGSFSHRDVLCCGLILDEVWFFLMHISDIYSINWASG